MADRFRFVVAPGRVRTFEPGPIVRTGCMRMAGDVRAWRTDWPPRYEPPRSRLLPCASCGLLVPLWYADKSVWRLAPRRFHKAGRSGHLCLDCFRRFVPER